MTAVTLIVRVEIAPQHADAFENDFVAVAETVRQEPGCIFYEGYRSQDQPTLFHFRECYASADALEAHGEYSHMRAFFEKVMPWVVEGPIVHRVKHLG